ncbi:MAG: mitochondrial fission ELM1 family protein [Xanthomonadaceae bacterium]|nr:mitochondrial fission ELM1 family protein [Xanthomonadaceae bacterium]
MPLITQRIVRGLTPFIDPYMTPANRQRPEKIILGVRPGLRPANKPPVRIFLGSERNQFRAERVFLWSIEKHRDPSRIYEIHLLKGLKGYISGFWITGFTNYRFAIPHFCAYQGRAIYNDVDQVWLTDPAELFDRDMAGAGFVSINDHDTSVMLIDCQRMAGVWNHAAVVKTTRKRIEARARAAGLWGPMEGRYNARDAEYQPGVSACVHFTTLHTQPWRPFPDWFVYQNNPTGQLWFDLERGADQARFMPVSALRPSSGWPDVALALSAHRDGPELVQLLSPRPDRITHQPTRQISGLLEAVPDGDLPWVLNRLFESCDQLQVRLREPLLIRRGRPRRTLHFWTEQFELAGRLNPQTRWRLERRVGSRRQVLIGGPLPDGPVAILSVSGQDSQAETIGHELARRTGRELVRIALPDNRPGRLFQLVFGRDPTKKMADQAAIVVAGGRYATRSARRLAECSTRPPALVLIGRRAGSVPEHAGVIVSMQHHDLPPHPNRLTTLLGVPANESARPSLKPKRWIRWLRPSKRSALLVGGPPHGLWSSHELDRMADDALDWSTRRKARLLIVTTSASATAAEQLHRRVGDRAEVYAWQDHDSENPYHLALEQAGGLLIAGAGFTLLRDALASGKPVFLMPEQKPRRPNAPLRARIKSAIAARIAARAFRPSFNKRGSIRPQQGLTYLSARLIERGRIVPPTGLAELQHDLIERGLAAWMGDAAVPSGRYRPELDKLVQDIVLRLEPNRACKGRGKNGPDRESAGTRDPTVSQQEG